MTYGGTPVEIGYRPERALPLPLIERLSTNDSWSVNPYGACDIRCAYCITSAQGRSWVRFGPDEVVARLRTELAAIDDQAAYVLGSYADGYPGVEATIGVTRLVVAELVRQALPFRVVTKGTTVVRDADLLTAAIEVQVSLNTVDEAAAARLEPGAPTPQARLAALHELAAAGVAVRLQASPWIPGVSDVAELRRLVDPAIEITVTPVRLPGYLERFGRDHGLTQADVNEAFRLEYERVGPSDRVRWSRPPPLDGAPPRIELNVGRHEMTDWTPAPAAGPTTRPVSRPAARPPAARPPTG